MARHAPQEAVLASPPKRGSSSLLGLAKKFLGESLFRNAGALVIDIGIGAVCGYGSLTLLTHVFSKNDIGLSATAVSACSLICFITEFGIGYSLPRFLPTAKNREAMINTVFTVVLVATVIGAAIFLALPYARNLAPLGGLTFGVVFVVTAAFQSSQAVLSTVLIADRAADKMVVFGAIPAVSRLAAPEVFSFLGALGSFVSRIIADFVGVAVFGALVHKRGHHLRLKIDVGETRELVKFSAGMYTANLVGGIPQLILPLIVLSRVGATPAAYWSIAMAIGALLYQVTGAVNSALLPEVSFRPMERRALLRRATMMSSALMVPTLTIAFFVAPFVLSIFGKSYAAGALVPLRWLIITGFITIVNYLGSSILFIAKKSTWITLGSLVEAVTMLGLVLLWATNVTQIAIAWTVANAAYTVVYLLFAYLALREVDGRWEDLGGTQAAAATAPADLSATSQLRALDVLATMAEQQNAVDMYWPYYPSMTATTGLFSVAAFRAAERQRQESMKGTEQARETRSPSMVRPPSEDRQHRQAFELLFKMAEAQRTNLGNGDNGNGNIPKNLGREPRNHSRPRE